MSLKHMIGSVVCNRHVVSIITTQWTLVTACFTFKKHDLWWVSTLTEQVTKLFCRQRLMLLKFALGIFQALDKGFCLFRIRQQCLKFTQQCNQFFSCANHTCNGGYIHV